MPVPSKYLAKIESELIYHIYNRTNDSERLFRLEEDYHHFISLFHSLIVPICHVYAWALLPNHFHFLVKVKKTEEVLQWIKAIPKELRTRQQQKFLSDLNLSELAGSQFKRFFTIYAMGYNHVYRRRGNLFTRQYKRVLIADDQQFSQALIYIHANGLKHKLAKHISEYKWSSYQEYVMGQSSFVSLEEVFNWFGSKEEFFRFHKENGKKYFHFIKMIER